MGVVKVDPFLAQVIINQRVLIGIVFDIAGDLNAVDVDGILLDESFDQFLEDFWRLVIHMGADLVKLSAGIGTVIWFDALCKELLFEIHGDGLDRCS